MVYKVKALNTYEKNNIKDEQLGYIPKEDEEFEVDEERLKVLLGKNYFNKVFVKLVKGNENTEGQEENENLEGQKGNENPEGQKGNENLEGQKGNENPEGQEENENPEGQEGNESPEGQEENENLEGQKGKRIKKK